MFYTLRTQTLSTMSFTAYGGCFIAFTIAISANVNVPKAAWARFKIGIASAKSASHSAFITAASFATTYLIIILYRNTILLLNLCF